MLRTIFSQISGKLTNKSSESNDKLNNHHHVARNCKNIKEKEDHAADHVTKHNKTKELPGIIIYADVSCSTEKNKNQLFTIKSCDDIEHTAFLPEIDWHAVVGDKVNMTVNLKDESCGEPLEIVKIVPKRKIIEFGRVTALGNQYAVFEESKILQYTDHINIPKLKMFDEYKMEVIESDQKSGISSFDYRVINLIEKVKNSTIGNGIIFKNKPFKIYLNQDDEKKEIGVKHIIICNKSDKIAVLKSIQFEPIMPENADLIFFDKTFITKKYYLKPKVGQFKAFFNIKPHPHKTGKFFFNLTTLFENFSEKHEFSIEIYKSYILPGEKFHKTPRFVDLKISDYGIPSDMNDVEFDKYQDAKEELENLYPCLKEKLTLMNYLERMKVCIFLEEIATKKAFASYHIERGVFEIKGELLKLTVKDIAEKRPSIIIGDKVIASDPTKSESDNKLVYEGYIHKVGDESIFCKFHSDFHAQYDGQKEYSIDFVYSRSSFRRHHHALETFTSNGELGYNFLFPNNQVCINEIQLDASVDSEGTLHIEKTPQKWYNNHLNKYQKNAIVSVLRGENRPLPYIFFGCPGSGKTLTVVETVLQIHRHIKSSKIIVATPSNSAANLIVEMLINSDVFDKENPIFIRIVSNNQVEKELVPDFLASYCGTVSIGSENNAQPKLPTSRNNNGILQNCTRSTIMKYPIIIATLNGIGCLMQMSLDSYFSHVIIDEAGQSIEPETIIPLSMMMAKKGQSILAGDPLQLGPIVLSRHAKNYKFNTSMLERFLLTHPYYAQFYGPDKNEYDSKFVTKLKINYRSHSTVLKVYNDLFYNSELESAVNDTDSHEALFLSSIDDLIWKNMNKNCGVIFVNVNNGKNKKIAESCSWYNDQEINGVMAFLNKCRTKNIPFKNIGILAPYALQVKKLKNQISFLNDSDLKVGTVEEFQGQERLVMIVSTVRTEVRHLSADFRFGLGFLQCPKRINVAISRSRALLVVFGKQSILEKDMNWKHIIDYTKANNTYVTENY